MFIISVVIAILLPCLLIAALIMLESYHLVRWPVLLLALGWGVISFYLSEGVETFATTTFPINYETLTILIAPLVEESFKSVAILVMYVFVLVRYTGDATIYGFAVGSGFAIVENLHYIALSPDHALGVALARVTSTGLIHAGIAAIVATAASVIVHYRWFHALRVALVMVLGAMIAHGIYNAVLWLEADHIIVLSAVITGMTTLFAILVLLNFNVRHETNQIIAELQHDPAQVLDHTVRQGDHEVNLLDYVRQTFGAEPMKLVHDYLLTQGQIAVYTEHLDNGDLRPAAIRALNREIDHHNDRALRVFNQMDTLTQDWLRQMLIADGMTITPP